MTSATITSTGTAITNATTTASSSEKPATKKRLLRTAADRIELIVREQRKVAGVGLERRVEDVAGEGDSAEHGLDRDVADHAQQDAARCTEQSRLVDDERGEQRADRIAESGHEADDRIEPDAIAARQRNRIVEQPGERAQPADALGGARRVGG